jgi:hypothetical protein
MKNYLSISIGEDSTLLQYVDQDEVVLTNTHAVGLKHLEAQGLSKLVASSFLDGIYFTLEHISLYDRIPTEFRLITPRYSTWVTSLLENEPYAQFFTNATPVRVTLERIKGGLPNSSLPYAGHSKTILSFKV